MLAADPSLARWLVGKRNLLGSLFKATSGDPIELDRAMFLQRLGDVRADGKPERLRSAIVGANLTGPQLDALPAGARVGPALTFRARAPLRRPPWSPPSRSPPPDWPVWCRRRALSS